MFKRKHSLFFHDHKKTLPIVLNVDPTIMLSTLRFEHIVQSHHGMCLYKSQIQALPSTTQI